MSASSEKKKPNKSRKKSHGSAERSTEGATSTSKSHKKVQVKTEGDSKAKNIFEKYILSSEDEPELPEDRWDGDKDWEVEKIIDESVDLAGKHKYQVMWKDWCRKSDGTNTTWVEYKDLISDAKEALEDWEQEKVRRIIERRKTYAKHGYPISLFSNQCVTRFATTCEELGMGRDQELTPQMIFSFPGESLDGSKWNQEIEQVRAEALRFMENPEMMTGMEVGETEKNSHFRPSIRRSDSELEHTAPSASVALVDSATISPSPSPMTPPRRPFRGPLSAQKKHDIKHNLSQPMKRSSSPHSITSTPSKRQNTGKARNINGDARDILQKKWSDATNQSMAASVHLVNDVDDELVPSSLDWESFEYIENGPYRTGEISHDGFYVGCECFGPCQDPQNCGCQDPEFAAAIFHEGKRSFAYDANGRYILDDSASTAVIECNQYCDCDQTCPNRVAQKPRDVPLEVFKTMNKGWGVRPTIFVPKGKVVGVFTGDLMRENTDQHDGWVFDLDGFDPEQPMVVSSRRCGNWSRFLNHSCFPNMKVYTVIYDSVPDAQDNPHRLAFVAIKDIMPRTEMTIDYHPQVLKKKGLKKCCKFGGCQ